MPRPGTPMVHPDMADAVRAWSDEGSESTCTIVPPDGTPTLDDGTGELAYEDAAAVYSGVCRIQTAVSSRVFEAELAADEPTVTIFEVNIPATETDVKVGHVVTVDSSPDPWLVNKTLMVRDVRGDDYAPGRLLMCEETHLG